MSYTFVKIKQKINGNNEYWLFKPKDVAQVVEHWYKYPASVIKEGTHHLVRKVLKSVIGHCNNDFERAVEVYMAATGTDLRTALVCVENEAFQSRIKSCGDKEIYLTHGMQVMLFDERVSEVIAEVEKETLTFPDEEKPSASDIRVLVWPGGVHYYAKIGSLDVVDKDGNQKWNTKEEALEAANWYIQENWKGK